MAVDNTNNKYSQQYYNEINDVFTNRMDGNGGKKDGKVTIKEAYNDLDIPSLFFGLEKGSAEYKKLKSLTDKIPDTLKKYAGSDGIFQAEEWANFINGKEWGDVLDSFHSSSGFSAIEMDWVDKSRNCIQDGQCTKGEVKVGLLNNFDKIKLPLIFDKERISNKIEAIVDKYAGEDGTFTVAEYTAMKNDPEYKQIIKDFGLFPFNLG